MSHRYVETAMSEKKKFEMEYRGHRVLVREYSDGLYRGLMVSCSIGEVPSERVNAMEPDEKLEKAIRRVKTGIDRCVERKAYVPWWQHDLEAWGFVEVTK